QVSRGLGTRAPGARVFLREVEVPPLDVGRTEELLHDAVLEPEEFPDLFLRIGPVRKCAPDGSDHCGPVSLRSWVANATKPQQRFISNHSEVFPARWLGPRNADPVTDYDAVARGNRPRPAHCCTHSCSPRSILERQRSGVGNPTLN